MQEKMECQDNSNIGGTDGDAFSWRVSFFSICF
jgi:hypothetical protein